MSRTHKCPVHGENGFEQEKAGTISLLRLQTVLVTLELQAPQQRVRETHR